jgi:hypothetical protein
MKSVVCSKEAGECSQTHLQPRKGKKNKHGSNKKLLGGIFYSHIHSMPHIGKYAPSRNQKEASAAYMQLYYTQKMEPPA